MDQLPTIPTIPTILAKVESNGTMWIDPKTNGYDKFLDFGTKNPNQLVGIGENKMIELRIQGVQKDATERSRLIMELALKVTEDGKLVITNTVDVKEDPRARIGKGDPTLTDEDFAEMIASGTDPRKKNEQLTGTPPPSSTDTVVDAKLTGDTAVGAKLGTGKLPPKKLDDDAAKAALTGIKSRMGR